MAKLTVIKAAKAGYGARPTIYKDIRSGKLSTEKNDRGTVVIEESELIRLYGPPTPKTEKEQAKETEAAALRKEVERLKKELEEATSEVATYRNKADEVQAEAKEERAQLLKIVEDTQRLLEDANKESRKGVFRKLFGG